MGKYSSWWRGVPAKDVGEATRAEVRVLSYPPYHPFGVFFYIINNMKWIKAAISWFFTISILGGIGTGFYFMYDSGIELGWVLLTAYFLINFSFFTLLFIQNRQLIGKLSWMMIFLLFPFIGHVAFALFGQRYKYRTTLKKYHAKDTFRMEKNSKGIKLDKEIESLFRKQSKISNRGIYKSDIEIYSSGDEGYEKLFQDLRNAKQFIHLQYYIIKKGEIFDELKSILLQKNKEGVKVRILVDDFGRWALPSYEIKTFRKLGIDVQIFGRIRFPFISSYNTYRLHRKVAIIDGKIVHTGGVNIADEYSSLNKKYGMWIDYQYRITGEGVRSFSLLYVDDWYTASERRLDTTKLLNEDKGGKSNIVLIEDSPENLEPTMQDSIVKMIQNAKKEILLTTPYFVPSPEIFAALRTAARSGIKIKIIIPGKPDKKAAIIVTRYYANELMKYGIEVYEAKNILIHTKFGLFDKKYAYLGTANLDIRSLFGQWEMIQLVSGPITKEIDKVFSSYLKLSKQIDKDTFKVSKPKEKLVRFYVNLFSTLM